MRPSRHFVLLTATVTPRSDQPELALVDPEARLKDYETALGFYRGLLVQGTISGIVFAENSGFDLGRLEGSFGAAGIEYLGGYDLDYPSTYHRGYGEFRLIDRAVASSRLLRDLRPEDRVWKITGRYVLRNMRRFVAAAPAAFDLYCDVTGDWAEMGVLAWSSQGHAHIIRDLWKELATGKVPELILAEKLRSRSFDPRRIVSSFYWPPFLEGRRAANGVSFQGRLGPLRFASAALQKSLTYPLRRAADALQSR